MVKKPTLLSCTWLLIAGTLVVAQEQPLRFRDWTDARSRTAKMAFVGFADGKLKMRNPEGKEYSLSLDQLAEQDQQYLFDSQLERVIDLNSTGRVGEALLLLKSMTTIHPRYAPAFLWLGKLEYAEEDWDAALEAYKAHNALQPNNMEGSGGVARVYAKQDKTELAKFWYKRALDADPTDESLKAELAALDNMPLPGTAAPPPGSAEATAPAPGPSQPSAAGTPEPADGAPAEEADSFWFQGIFGLLGARTVWWGRLLAVIFFSLGMLFALIATPGMYKTLYGSVYQSKEQLGCATFFGSGFGFAIGYMIWWGVPYGARWFIIIPVTLICAIIAAVATAAD